MILKRGFLYVLNSAKALTRTLLMRLKECFELTLALDGSKTINKIDAFHCVVGKLDNGWIYGCNIVYNILHSVWNKCSV